MKSPLSLDCGTLGEARPSGGDQITPQTKKRVRHRSVTIQIQELLNSAQSLDKEPTNDLTIARMKFLQARLLALKTLQARERRLKRALAEVDRLTAENGRLRELVNQLAKPAARPLTPAEQILAQYEATKNGGQQ